jgi:hypothetical protein
VVDIMDGYRTTGWACAWGSAFGALVGGTIDFLIGSSGLMALVLAGLGSLTGSYVGFRAGLRDTGRFESRTDCLPEIAGIHRQHQVMWSLMGAMVGGVLGSALGAGVASLGWVFYIYHVPTMMDCMLIVNVVMGGGMGGMTGGVSGAWWSAVRTGFVKDKRDVSLSRQQSRSEVTSRAEDFCGGN